ncbi:protein SAWADEE HOMEODOMAIN HOMOLOG 1-like isoform X3 [Cucurbita moschata]|uniref:Protein SAWADEE HOMEODOMAIN HOMOLOG 1-like isoform X3 n=1 Tax=Cucurbita moschata TaxID=3662 RepID=A0A6J1FDM4_CUCMO|nr:protein SAWADEE HOMEODOMAIN HOMOLOG 1-like isoform X3 [Cucurbita moschata]
MERLRPRDRQMFSGFTKGEIAKMEKLIEESGEQLLDRDFCQKVTKRFKYTIGLKADCKTSQKLKRGCLKFPKLALPIRLRKVLKAPKMGPFSFAPPHANDLCLKAGKKKPDLSELEFEARSSKDGAWYDVAMFLTHRFLSSGEAEVRVRFVGFGAEEDEWVNIKQSVRERSVPLEHSECQKVKAGDLVLCFQERRDQAIYYDAHIVEVQRRMHDIRGCRCLFLIRYDHDSTEEKVRLRRLCRRPAHQF